MLHDCEVGQYERYALPQDPARAAHAAWQRRRDQGNLHGRRRSGRQPSGPNRDPVLIGLALETRANPGSDPVTVHKYVDLIHEALAAARLGSQGDPPTRPSSRPRRPTSGRCGRCEAQPMRSASETMIPSGPRT
jgi:hypothetical protein